MVREIDPAVPGYGIARLGDLVDARLSQERMLNLLSLLFAALALMVASAGLYGRVVHSVVRRRREIGIRLAVGAPRQSIVGLFTADVLRLVALGVVIGVPLALLVGRRFSAVLYNVEPGSLSSLSVAAAVLGAVSVLAVVVPAARAARLDPTATLREP